MVRAFAARAGYLRQNLSLIFQEGKVTAPFASVSTRNIRFNRPIFESLLPYCVILFLLTISAGAILQFRYSREATLAASEHSLFTAGELLAMKMSVLHTQAKDKSEALDASLDAFTALPYSIQAHGRQFLVLDGTGKIALSREKSIPSGRHISELLGETLPVSALIEGNSIQQIQITSGEIVSIAAFSLPSYGLTLVLYQPIKDELYIWSQDASILTVLLLCCIITTLYFTLALCAQRTRTRSLGDHASRMQTQFESALNRGNCGLWEYNLASGRINFSQSMFRLLGFNSADHLDLHSFIEHRLHEEDVSPLRLMKTLYENGAHELEHLFRMRHADHHWIWLRMRAVWLEPDATNSRTLIGIVMDVTDEKKAELESHRADMRLREAIEAISEAFVLWDENNKLVMCNSKFRSFQASHKTDFQAENSSYETQYADGGWLLVSERTTKCGGRVMIGTDITARKKQEEALVENERQLKITIRDLGSSREALRKQAKLLAKLANLYQEQKMEVIGATRLKAEFLANMNHEIRTPLNHIINFAEMINLQLVGGHVDDRYKQYARDIKMSGEYLLMLISDILEMAQIEAGRVHINRAHNKVGEVLESAALQVIEDAKVKNISLHIEPDCLEAHGQREIYVDRIFLSQALAHLLRNSIRLSPLGGHISMRARIVGDHINMFIADRGYTLSADDISTMSSPFGHIDGMLQDGCKGSGLGTAIARSLIELHGGSVRMRALPNNGSISMVRLPIQIQSIQLFLPMTDFSPLALH